MVSQFVFGRSPPPRKDSPKMNFCWVCKTRCSVFLSFAFCCWVHNMHPYGVGYFHSLSSILVPGWPRSFRNLLLCVSKSGPTSSSQKGVDSHIAREPVYKPHVGPRFVVDFGLFLRAENRPNSQKKGGVGTETLGKWMRQSRNE